MLCKVEGKVKVGGKIVDGSEGVELTEHDVARFKAAGHAVEILGGGKSARKTKAAEKTAADTPS